jgi:hypothetical protein
LPLQINYQLARIANANPANNTKEYNPAVRNLKKSDLLNCQNPCISGVHQEMEQRKQPDVPPIIIADVWLL